MESDNMDISSSTEEDDDDDEAELNNLLSALSGMERCLLPAGYESNVGVVEHRKENKTNNNNIVQENRAVTPPGINNDTTRCKSVEISDVCSVVAVSPISSNASTLSKDSTPERQILHCQKDCGIDIQSPIQVTIAQLLNKDSDNDIIMDNINKYRKNLEDGPASDHSDVTYLGTNTKTDYLNGKAKQNSTLPDDSELNSKSNDSVIVDDAVAGSSKIVSMVEVPVVTSVPTQSEENANASSTKNEDSDSDCLIVEHIAASDHRLNGLIDLTKPNSDEDVLLSLESRTEESLLKEISEIRKALMKHTTKRRKRKRRGKCHKPCTNSKKKKKSKRRTKSPSLEKISENEDEIENEPGIITLSQSDKLSVNISSYQSMTDSCEFHCSSETTKSKEKENAVDMETPMKIDEFGLQKLPKITDPSDNTDSAESPPIWNSDSENAPEFNGNSNVILESNPLRRKLSYCADQNVSKKARKRIFCESGKELKSKFRRKGSPKTNRTTRNNSLVQTSKFDRYSFSSNDSDFTVKNLQRSVPSSSKFNRFMSDSDSDKSTNSVISRKPGRVDLHQNTINTEGLSKGVKRSSPSLSYLSHYNRRSRSPNHRRSLSRSPSRYRSCNRSSYRSPRHKSPSRACLHHQRISMSRSPTPEDCLLRSKSPSDPRCRSRAMRSPSRSRRSGSRAHKSPSRSFRSASRTYRSPSRSRRSKSRTYRSPSRSRRSKSRTYRSPSRSRRSKSRTYRSPSRSRRSESRTYRSPSRSRRSKSRSYRSPSRSRRSQSHTYRSPSRLRRSKSRQHRNKSRCTTPRRSLGSRSPSVIRAARACSPLEDMRQQLRKNNEAAVQQALGGLEKRTKEGTNLKACKARIIDDVDLTKSSSSPETCTEMNVLNRNAPTVSAIKRSVVPQQPSSSHSNNVTASHQNDHISIHSITGF